MKNMVGMAAALLWGMCAVAPAAADDLREITLDAAKPVGVLRALSGVNGPPAPGYSKPFGYGGRTPRDPDIDVSAGYRAARISLIRTHDSYGAGDIDAHFIVLKDKSPMAPRVPTKFNVRDIFPDMNADPANPASYNWGPTDRMIGSIEDIGAEPLFRIGRSEGADPTPPANVGAYAEVVRHVVLHYNKGWDHGMHYGIRYWEVWNEPDLGNLFWGGTPQQYYALYDAVARAVKSADPHALVGGPPLSRPLDDTGYDVGFLDHVRATGVPYDFQGWHYYTLDNADPWVFNRIANHLEALMQAHGFGKIPLILNEWGGDWFYGGALVPAHQTTFTVAALIAMQDSPITAQTLYRGDDAFGADGKTPDGVGWALILNGMMQDTPLRLAMTGGDQDGFAVLGGMSRDHHLIQVLLANYEIAPAQMGPRAGGDKTVIPGIVTLTQPPRRVVHYANNQGYVLKISGLQPNALYQVERYRVSAGHPYALVDRAVLKGSAIHLSADLPPPAVEMIRISALSPN